jgi:hypothetical protein
VVANARAENQNQDRLSTVNRELSAKAKAMDSLRRVGLDSEPTAVRDDHFGRDGDDRRPLGLDGTQFKQRALESETGNTILPALEVKNEMSCKCSLNEGEETKWK